MKIKTLKLTRQGRSAFRNQKADLILSIDSQGNAQVSKTPKIGDTISIAEGNVPVDQTIHLPAKNLSIVVKNGKVIEVIDLKKITRKAFRK